MDARGPSRRDSRALKVGLPLTFTVPVVRESCHESPASRGRRSPILRVSVVHSNLRDRISTRRLMKSGS
jgi:hypothetical protein